MNDLIALAWRRLRRPPGTHRVLHRRDLRIPMPDGTVQLADRHHPEGVDDAPLILIRSPYGRRGIWAFLFARPFAERGYQVVIASCRGTAGSGGTFDPFGTERADGLATIAWLRNQPWYPGRFATVGPSYLGYTQWAVAGHADDHAAMVVQVAPSALHHMILAGGSLSLEVMLGWTSEQERRMRPLGLLRAIGARRRLARALHTLPLGVADTAATGHRVDYYQQWLANPDPDGPYWHGRGFDADVGAVTTPVSLLAGWYDFMLPWQLADYAALRAAGRDPHLTIGPWTHVDPAGIREWMRQTFHWLGIHLRGDTPTETRPPVRVYVTGADRWHHLTEWPPPGRTEQWRLAAGHGLTPAPGTGDPAPAHPTSPDAGVDGFTYDPADPTPAAGGARSPDGAVRVDNTTLEARPDVVTYTGAPIDQALDVAGTPAVDLHLRSSTEHLDVFVRLCDVDPAGRSVNITDGLLRVGPDTTPDADGVHTLRIEMWPAAHRFAPGHRLRLQISGGAFPRYPRNHGTGEPTATAVAGVPSTREVHHGGRRPSALLLPVTEAFAEA